MGVKRIKYKEYSSIWDRKRRGGVRSKTAPIFGPYERRGGDGSGGSSQIRGGGDSYGSSTTFGKYIAKVDVFTNRHVIDDEETKTTYKLEWAERHAFSDAHEEFGSIQEWYDSLDKETQERIIRILLDDKMKEIKEG